MPKNETYLTVTGEIRYNMTNDYMFRAILQKNERVLRGLVASLLHMQPEEIETISIENPIVLGEDIDEKTIVLDVKIKLNNNSYLNLEMQVLNEKNWTDRSLFYLCRTFGQLEKGNDYTNLLPATHIGFLDFTLFPKYPEFFATYKLLNTKNYHLYSDKFVLNVVDLNRTDLATDEDKVHRIDHWVKLFKATTWEELRMLSQDLKYAEDMMQTLYECNADEKIRRQCNDREAELEFQKMKDRKIMKLNEENSLLSAEIAQLSDEIIRLKALLAQHNIKIP